MPNSSRSGLLLDTHVWIWLVEGSVRLATPVVERIESAAASGSAYVSAISLLEVAMLVVKQRVRLHRPLAAWLGDATRLPGLAVLPLTAAIAVEWAGLTQDLPGDPADRVLAATARSHQLTLVTHDRVLLSFAAPGHMAVMKA